MRPLKACLWPLVTTALFAVATSGCVHSNDQSKVKDFIDQDLVGRIGGDKWEVKHAFINPLLHTHKEEDYVLVLLPFVPKNPCPRDRDLPSDIRTAMVPMPMVKKVTKIKRGGARNLVFQFDRGKRQIALSARAGKIQLTSLGGDKVRGKIVAQLNTDNWLNGRFTAVKCDLRDFKDDRRMNYGE